MHVAAPAGVHHKVFCKKGTHAQRCRGIVPLQVPLHSLHGQGQERRWKLCGQFREVCPGWECSWEAVRQLGKMGKHRKMPGCWALDGQACRAFARSVCSPEASSPSTPSSPAAGWLHPFPTLCVMACRANSAWVSSRLAEETAKGRKGTASSDRLAARRTPGLHGGLQGQGREG